MPGSRKKYRQVVGMLAVAGALILGTATAFHGFGTFFSRVYADFLYPYLELPNRAKNLLSEQTMFFHGKSTLMESLKELQAENRILAARYASAVEAQFENRELRRLLELDRKLDFSYVNAEIHRREPMEWRERFIINRGAAAGIKVGSPVLTFRRGQTGQVVLCGIVKSVSRHTAEVITILSPHAKISVKLKEYDISGFINAGTTPPSRTQRGEFAVINYLPTGYDYQQGGEVVTGGFETHIPAGIPVGTFDGVIGGDSVFDNRLYVNGLLSPAADLDNIRFLIVLTRKQDVMVPEPKL
ncbi:MAG: rod shape-determining protein MreC [Lentisphaerae bacterium]|nr:rod shape-determining protein MreC [Lentisphaerota bacterium]